MKNRLSDELVISKDNVKRLGELIGISALRIMSAYCGGRLDKMYVGLLKDTCRAEDSLVPFSDGYDVAATAICFLCEHMGKRLGEMITYRFGHIISVKSACYKVVYNFIQKRRKYMYSTVTFEELTPRQEPYYLMEEKEEDDSAIDNTIELMNLSDTLKETLCCYIAGMTYVEIARFLSVNNTTIWRRRKQLQAIYTAKFGGVR